MQKSCYLTGGSATSPSDTRFINLIMGEGMRCARTWRPGGWGGEGGGGGGGSRSLRVALDGREIELLLGAIEARL